MSKIIDGVSSEKLEKFLDTYDRWYKAKKPNDPFKVVVKMGEEYGEVCESMFALSGTAKKVDKLKAKGVTPREALLEETGDLLVTIFNVLRVTGHSIDEMLELHAKKMEGRINGR
jgi:NTP pyrophosphatase (non-canonical NTP hydrolase)